MGVLVVTEFGDGQTLPAARANLRSPLSSEQVLDCVLEVFFLA